MKSIENSQISQIAHTVGLTNIFTENMTPRLREILVMERDRAMANKAEFVQVLPEGSLQKSFFFQKFSESLYEKLLEGWADKLQFIDDDNQNWLLLRAEKPVHPHAYLTEAGA